MRAGHSYAVRIELIDWVRDCAMRWLALKQHFRDQAAEKKMTSSATAQLLADAPPELGCQLVWLNRRGDGGRKRYGLVGQNEMDKSLWNQEGKRRSCPRCGTTIKKIYTMDGDEGPESGHPAIRRRTFYCPQCQPE